MLSLISSLTSGLFGASWTKIVGWGLLALTVALMLTMGALVAAHERGKRLEAERDIAITERDAARSQTKRLVVSIEEANRRLEQQRTEIRLIQSGYHERLKRIRAETEAISDAAESEGSNADQVFDTRYIR